MDPLFINSFWDSGFVWVTFLVGAMSALGMASKSFTVGAFAGYLTFVILAVETQNQLLLNILYVTLLLILVTFGFKLLRVEEID